MNTTSPSNVNLDAGKTAETVWIVVIATIVLSGSYYIIKQALRLRFKYQDEMRTYENSVHSLDMPNFTKDSQRTRANTGIRHDIYE